MRFVEALREPLVLIVVLVALLTLAFSVWFVIWYFRVGYKRSADAEMGYNEKQCKHLAFRRAFIIPMIVGSVLLGHLTHDSRIPLPNGNELPVELLVLLGSQLLFWTVMHVAGRLIFGEEGRLKPKKEESGKA